MGRKLRLEIDTADLMKEFGILPKDMEWEEAYDWGWNNLYYDVQREEVDSFIHEHKISGCDDGYIYGSIEQAWKDAVINDIEKQARENLANILSEISDVDYEYYKMEGYDEEGERVDIPIHGKARAIEQVFVTFDKTVLIVDEDIMQLFIQADIIDYDDLETMLTPMPSEDLVGAFDRHKNIPYYLKNYGSDLLETFGFGADMVDTQRAVNEANWSDWEKFAVEMLNDECEIGKENYRDWWIKEGRFDDCSETEFVDGEEKTWCSGHGWVTEEQMEKLGLM